MILDHSLSWPARPSSSTPSLGSPRRRRPHPRNVRTRFARLATRSRAFAARNVNAPHVLRLPLPVVARTQCSPALAPLTASLPTPSLAALARRTTLARSGERPLVIRPQTVSLALPSFRSARPFRLRRAAGPPSRGPQRPSPLAARTRAEPAAPRYATGAAAVAADPRLCGPSAYLRLHVRTPLHSGRSTATDCSSVRLTPPVRHKPIPARRDAAASLRARQAGCSPAVADSPSLNVPGPARARRATCASEARLRRPHAPVGFDARRAQRGSEHRAARSQGSLTSQCERAHQCECHSFAPAPAVPGPALAMAGEASARATALRRPRLRPASCPRPSSARPFPRPRPASRAFSVTAAACCGRTIRRYAKRALHRASSRYSVGPEHSLRGAPSHYISRDCAIHSGGSLRAVTVSRARTNVTGGKPPP